MIKLLNNTAKKAGKILMNHFQKDVEISFKTGHHDLVTPVDFKAQKFIKKKLTKGMVKLGYNKSQIGFVGEEDLNEPREFTFVIDPIDGTTNFASGIPVFAVSIAAFKNNELVASSNYLPTENLLYYAQKGMGAFTNNGKKDIRLQVAAKSINECLIGMYMSYNYDARQKLFHLINEINEQTRGVRVIGSSICDICYAADNRIGVAVHAFSKIWDIAGAALIVTEAGGVVTDWQGEAFAYDVSDRDKRYPMLAGHEDNVKQILKYL